MIEVEVSLYVLPWLKSVSATKFPEAPPPALIAVTSVPPGAGTGVGVGEGVVGVGVGRGGVDDGVGVGVGVGLLIAPASGEETRADIANKVSDFGEKVRDRERKPQGATGTHGE